MAQPRHRRSRHTALPRLLRRRRRLSRHRIAVNAAACFATASQAPLAAVASAVRCEEVPPRVWRHFGCERWDCGDLSPVPEGCRWLRTGYSCEEPTWNCSSQNTLVADGAFACVSGTWADILPHCLGDTAPAVKSGTWKTVSRRVRGVLWKLNISWGRLPTNYRPELCTTNALGHVAECRRTGFGQLLERQLWPLLGRPLEDALCKAERSGTDTCNAGASTRGDRLRVAGVYGGPYDVSEQSATASYGEGSLEIYFEGVPLRAADAERLRDDVTAVAETLDGFAVASEDVWGDFEQDVNVSDRLPLRARWLRSGFEALRRAPENYLVTRDRGFTSQWLPMMRVGISSPYVINRLDVPDWEFARLVAPQNELAEQLVHLSSVEDIAVRCCCGLLGAAWAIFLLLRCCLWELLYGAQHKWSVREAVQGVSAVALLADVNELAAVLLVFCVTVWLSAYGVFGDASTLDFRRPANGALLLPAVMLFVVPGSALSWQLLQEGGNLVAARARLCCCRLLRRHWLRTFIVIITLHGFVLLVITSYAIVQVARGDGGSVAEPSVEACLAEVAEQCQTHESRQLPPFDSVFRRHCARNCAAELWPLRGASARFETFAYRIEVAVGTWALVARIAQLWTALVLEGTRETSRPKKSHAAVAAAAVHAEVAQAVAANDKLAVISQAFGHPRSKTNDMVDISTGNLAPGEPMRIGGFFAAAEGRSHSKELGRSQSKGELQARGSRTPRSSLSSRGGGASARSAAAEEDWADRILEAIAVIDSPPSANADGFLQVPRPAPTAATAAPPLALSLPSLSSEAAAPNNDPAAVAAQTTASGGARANIAVAEVFAGEEGMILSFAQQIARQCSRDTFESSGPTALSRASSHDSSRQEPWEEDLFAHRQVAKAKSSTSGERKKRYVADW